MLAGFAKAIFGSSNDRYVRSLRKTVDKINAFEPSIQALSDDELKGQTEKFKARLDGYMPLRKLQATLQPYLDAP